MSSNQRFTTLVLGEPYLWGFLPFISAIPLIHIKTLSSPVRPYKQPLYTGIQSVLCYTMNMITTLEKNDLIVENDGIRASDTYKEKFVEATGYPFNLTENQVTRLIYFFASRRCSTRISKTGKKQVRATKVTEFTSMEKIFIDECFTWFNIVYKDKEQMAAAYRAVVAKYKKIIDFLRVRPAFITKGIHKALETGGYKAVLKNVIMVVDENRNVVPRLIGSEEKENTIPLGKMESMLWQFQNVLTDKMMLILEAITPMDIKRANLGGKSKALRDLYSVMHMLKQGTKNPNMTLIGLNVNVAGPKEKLQAMTSYVIKNREGSS